MRTVLIPLLIAMQFLTRLPVSFLLKQAESQNDIYTPGNQSRSLKYYPLVGFIIGLLLVAFIFILYTFAVSHTFYIAVLTVFLWVALGGGLHLDGVADMADAWIGGLGDKDKTLRIMKDPACGPFGVIAIVFTLLLKLAFVYELVMINPLLILLPPLLSRIVVVALLMRIPYVRPQGMGHDLSASPDKHKNTASIIIAVIVSGYLLALLSGWTMVLGVFIACGLFYYMFISNVIKRIGGITGDIAGAFIEYTELVVLFSLVTLTFIMQSI